MLGNILGAVAGSVVSGLLGKKDSKSKETTQQSNPQWDMVAPYLQPMYGAASDLAKQQMGSMPGAPQLAASMPYAPYFPYATNTAYNPDTRSLEGLQSQLGYAQNYLPGMVDAQYQGYYDLLNAQDVASNPYLNQLLGQQVGAGVEAFGQNVGRFQDAFGSSLTDIGDVLTREWLPGIESGASLANQYGGTRQGVAEGVAMGDATQALSSAVKTGMLGLSDYGTNAARALSGNLANTQMGAWGQGLDAQQNAMQMAPQIAQLGMLPGQIYQNVGNTLDAYRQQQIDAEKSRWDYEQNAQINQMRDAEQRALQNYNLAIGGMQNQWMPLNNMRNILGGVTPNQTTTGTLQQGGNMANSLLGGAMTGWSLGGQIGNLFGSGSPSTSLWSAGGSGGTIPGMGSFIY